MTAALVVVLPLELDDRRLDELLSLWERYMRSNQPVRELGFPDTACGCVGGGYSQTFEDMLEAADARCAEAVNGAIESLTFIEQCAVNHMHLRAVYRMREPVYRVYERARGILRAGLPSRGVY